MTEVQVLNKFLNDIKLDLIKNYNRLGLKASGKWGNELEVIVKETKSGVNGKILGLRYTGALTDGRKPNKKQDEDSIRRFVGWAGSTFLKDWVKQKRLDISPFAVAHKIAKEGVKVPNSNNPGTLISDVINGQRINEFTSSIRTVFKINVSSEIAKEFK